DQADDLAGADERVLLGDVDAVLGGDPRVLQLLTDLRDGLLDLGVDRLGVAVELDLREGVPVGDERGVAGGPLQGMARLLLARAVSELPLALAVLLLCLGQLLLALAHLLLDLRQPQMVRDLLLEEPDTRLAGLEVSLALGDLVRGP